MTSEDLHDSEKLPDLLGSWTIRIVFGLLACVVLGGVLYIIYGSKLDVDSKLTSPLISLVVAVLFCSAPLLACFAHTISIERQKKKLQGLVYRNLMETQYFKIATGNLDSIQPASVEQPDFLVPMLLFAAIIIFCSLISFMSLFWPEIFLQKSPILGGLNVIMNDVTDRDVALYQSGTLVVAAIAFVGRLIALSQVRPYLVAARSSHGDFGPRFAHRPCHLDACRPLSFCGVARA